VAYEKKKSSGLHDIDEILSEEKKELPLGRHIVGGGKQMNMI